MSRAREVTAKLARVRDWLDGSDFDAALFSSQPGVAWVTAGLEDRVVRNEEPALVWVLVTAAGAWLITTNIEQPRILAEEDIAGFSVRVVPWHSPRGLAGAVDDLAGGSKVGEGPASLRMPLGDEEAERMAVLGADTARALEGAMRSRQPVDSECDLAAVGGRPAILPI